MHLNVGGGNGSMMLNVGFFFLGHPESPNCEDDGLVDRLWDGMMWERCDVYISNMACGEKGI